MFLFLVQWLYFKYIILSPLFSYGYFEARKREFVIILYTVSMLFLRSSHSPLHKHQHFIIMILITLIIYDPIHKYPMEVDMNLPNVSFLN